MSTTAELPPRDGAGRAFSDVRWTARDVLFGAFWFVAIFVLGQVAIVPLLVVYGETSGQLYSASFIAGAVVEVAIAGVAANFTLRRYGGGWAVLGVRRPDRAAILWGIAAFAAALGASVAYAGLIEAFNADWLKTDCAKQIPKDVRETRALLALASVTVIAFAPVCEELFFRGFLFAGLAKRWGLAAGVVVSGMVFASVHLQYQSFLPIAAVGIVFAYSYARSRNIITPIIAHLAFNSVSIAAIAAGSCDTTSSITLLRWPL